MTVRGNKRVQSKRVSDDDDDVNKSVCMTDLSKPEKATEAQKASEGERLDSDKETVGVKEKTTEKEVEVESGRDESCHGGVLTDGSQRRGACEAKGIEGDSVGEVGEVVREGGGGDGNGGKGKENGMEARLDQFCLLYTSPSPRDYAASRMPSSA